MLTLLASKKYLKYGNLYVPILTAEAEAPCCYAVRVRRKVPATLRCVRLLALQSRATSELPLQLMSKLSWVDIVV